MFIGKCQSGKIDENVFSYQLSVSGSLLVRIRPQGSVLMERLLGARLHPQLILANDAVVTTFLSATALYSSTIDPAVLQNDMKIAIYTVGT